MVPRSETCYESNGDVDKKPVIFKNAPLFTSSLGSCQQRRQPANSRLDYQPLFGKMSPHSSPFSGRIKDRTRETAEIEPKRTVARKFYQEVACGAKL